MVLADEQSSKRILYPTSWPRATSISSETRCATDMAATLLGCVQHTPFVPTDLAYSTHHCGICVVFPEPVSPTNTMHWFCARSLIKSARYSNTGNVILFRNSSWYLCVNGNPLRGFTEEGVVEVVVTAVLIPRSSLQIKHKL